VTVPLQVPVRLPPLPVLGVRLNVAVTDRFEFIVTVQLPVPEQAPDHPAKVDPEPGEALSVTTVPLAYVGPVGLALTPPVPVPAYPTVRVNVWGVRLNVAVTDRFEFIVTVQLPVPEQAPDHPVNVEPVFGVATSVTTVPLVYVGPDGLALTAPLPVPAYATVRINCWDVELNVAVTERFEFIVTVQLPVPEQAPDHPVNVEPVLGVATSVTTVPAAKLRQLAPQLRLEEDELALIVPLPVPDVTVVKLYC
jgi:hypothetical protein